MILSLFKIILLLNQTTKCSECKKRYCRLCNSEHWRCNFQNWTSGNYYIDDLIRTSQLNATRAPQLLEWIEYSNLKDIEHLGEGGFGSVYKAIWKDGPIKYRWHEDEDERGYWDAKQSEWIRQGETLVAVKKYRNGTRMSIEILNEIQKNLELNPQNYVNKIYGLTRIPVTHEYAVVTEFQAEGNLREVISARRKTLTWLNVILMLRKISWGLYSIHQNNYHHKDLHSGNILNRIFHGYERDDILSVISDFGLCRPIDENDEKTLYGVIPFVAPEVLRGERFTNAADVYGFGMIMWEILSGEPPFIDREYDEYLIRDICMKQMRPTIPEYTPQPLTCLIERCWDAIPTKRPTAQEVYEMIQNCSNPDDSQMKEEFNKEREDRWKAQLAEKAEYPRLLKESHNSLTSKRIDCINGEVLLDDQCQK